MKQSNENFRARQTDGRMLVCVLDPLMLPTSPCMVMILLMSCCLALLVFMNKSRSKESVRDVISQHAFHSLSTLSLLIHHILLVSIFYDGG